MKGTFQSPLRGTDAQDFKSQLAQWTWGLFCSRWHHQVRKLSSNLDAENTKEVDTKMTKGILQKQTLVGPTPLQGTWNQPLKIGFLPPGWANLHRLDASSSPTPGASSKQMAPPGPTFGSYSSDIPSIKASHPPPKLWKTLQGWRPKPERRVLRGQRRRRAPRRPTRLARSLLEASAPENAAAGPQKAS